MKLFTWTTSNLLILQIGWLSPMNSQIIKKKIVLLWCSSQLMSKKKVIIHFIFIKKSLTKNFELCCLHKTLVFSSYTKRKYHLHIFLWASLLFGPNNQSQLFWRHNQNMFQFNMTKYEVSSIGLLTWSWTTFCCTKYIKRDHYANDNANYNFRSIRLYAYVINVIITYVNNEMKIDAKVNIYSFNIRMHDISWWCWE